MGTVDKGTLVYGDRFADFCKIECVTACPLHPFRKVAAPTRPEGHPAEA